jgi:ABC-type phosphate/phosphonate transport system permease subunit
LLTLLAAVPGVFVMFSDRAPGWLAAVTERIQRLDSRPGDAVRATGIDDPDVVVHLVIWAVAAFLIVLMAWSWRSLVAGLAALFLAGVAVEAAQQHYTTSRAAEWNDVLGNTIGLGAGAAVGLVVWLAVRLLLTRRRITPPVA